MTLVFDQLIGGRVAFSTSPLNCAGQLSLTTNADSTVHILDVCVALLSHDDERVCLEVIIWFLVIVI